MKEYGNQRIRSTSWSIVKISGHHRRVNFIGRVVPAIDLSLECQAALEIHHSK